jgi:hypothetical protein
MSNQGPYDPNQQQPYGQQPPQYGQQPYGQQPPQYPSAPQYQGGYGYNAPPQQAGTNGMAIASLVVSFFCSIIGIILGIIALNQIKQSGQGGRGLAIAGIVIGCVSIVIGIAIVAGGH